MDVDALAGILVEVFWCEAYVQATDIVGDSETWWIQRGPGRDGPRHEESSFAPREPEFEATPPPAPPAPEPEASDEPFDPGRWRREADIPPIDDEPDPPRA